MYTVLNGDALRFDSLRFTAVSSSGQLTAVAKAALLLNSLVPDEDPQLGEVPIELRGDGSVHGRDNYPTENKTLYRAKKVPVRTYGLGNFPGAGLGLCL
jgi:hypothetical protein